MRASCWTGACASNAAAGGTAGSRWVGLPTRAVVDSVGRIVVPKPLRDALGRAPGTEVDLSRYGAGLHLVPSGRTARLVEEDGVLVSRGSGAVTVVA